MIKVSRMADYAFVLLSQLSHDRKTPLSADTLAQRTHLPLPTVRKVMKQLCRGKMVLSQRGGHGGYKLAAAPETLSVLDIFESIEGRVYLTPCVDGAPAHCAVESFCCLNGGWNVINRTVRDALEQVTLADMNARSPMQRLMRPPEEARP